MPLQKSIETDSGDTGDHMVVTYFHWDSIKREASGHFALYKSQAHHTAGKRPQRDYIARLKVTGTNFDTHFSDAAVAKAGGHVAQIEALAISHPQFLDSAGNIPGHPFFADAKRV